MIVAALYPQQEKAVCNKVTDGDQAPSPPSNDNVKRGINPLFSCENERLVSLALLAGSGEIVGKNKKSRGHDLHCLKSRGSGDIFA